MRPSSLRALFRCHSILLGEYIASPGCHHVYACLYMSTSVRSIFGRGPGSCQLLSSIAQPEGPTPTALPELIDLSGQCLVPFSGAHMLDVSA